MMILTSIVILNKGIYCSLLKMRIVKSIIISIDYSLWFSIFLLTIQCATLIVLISILILTLMKDFYNKHFNFSSQKRSVYDIYLSIVKNFPMILLTIFIGYVIRLFCRYSVGVLFLFEVNNNIIFKILVILLSLPWSSYLMNFIKKILEGKRIEDEDWGLFNSYVVNSVTIYNMVYISIFAYVFYRLHYSYYLLLLLLIILILSLVLWQKSKSNRKNYENSNPHNGLVLQSETSPIIIFATLVLQAATMIGYSNTGSTELDSTDEYPGLFYKNNTLNFVHQNYMTNKHLHKPEVAQYEQLKQSRILRIVQWQKMYSTQGSTGFTWSYLPKSLIFNEQYAGSVGVIPESKSLVVTLVNRTPLSGSKAFMYSNYFTNRLDPSPDKFRMIRETITQLENKFNMVIEQKEEIENIITFTQVEVVQSGDFRFFKVHRPAPYFEDLINTQINNLDEYYGINGNKVAVPKCIKYNKYRVRESIRRIQEGVQTPERTSARMMSNCFDISILKYVMLWKWLRKVTVEPRLCIGHPENVDAKYENLHHLIENNSQSVLLFKLKDTWIENERMDISLAKTRESALNYIDNSLRDKIDPLKKNIYVICVNKFTVEILLIEDFRSRNPKIYTFMDPTCKRIFVGQNFHASSYNYSVQNDEHSFRKFLDYITRARSRGTPVFKSHWNKKDSYVED